VSPRCLSLLTSVLTRSLDLLRRRQGIVDSLNAPGSDLEEGELHWTAIDALEAEIAGTPALTAAGALACLQAFASKECRSKTGDRLLAAVAGFLQRRMWEEEMTLRQNLP
jgi:hypothetical protein